ncbi:DNA polymerase beta domain protein region [Thermoanaerobacter mathranii subsp. mathranii str. A3]|uniref:DNA polymerase beta domain protein region n=1 Tax=Thermoanaerobacter mathranii subsp. mathranii (strain DSM 11426 / CCUG 53645 / CIP 108742 / A3) TaxID=583358 RepID=A0ABN3Z6K8_THEM3|nr:nucleotidyltransferase domain-containing protein [Thermoanaerobacter mathranii]ADH61500.1 DNA polymerase beta domain protein region [Thermoanaerobacter mathranii subsp. mathranii str. A3]
MIEATELLKYSLEDELKRITNIIIEKCNPERIILFGSMANGTAKEWSDIDLVVIMNTDLKFIDRLLYLAQITNPEIPVDFLAYTPEEEKNFIESGHLFYTEEVLKKGVVLYDKRASRV